MKADRREISDSELRALLRHGDPSGDGAGPTAEEWARMRREVVEEAEARAAAGRPWRHALLHPGPALAAAALATIAVGFLIVVRSTPGPTFPDRAVPTAPSTAPQDRAREATAAAPETLLAAEAAPETPIAAEATPETPIRAEVAAERPIAAEVTSETPIAAEVTSEAPVAVPVAPAAVPVARVASVLKPRTVRLTAPRGTRIIWTLDPEFEFPVSEPDDEARGVK